MSEQEAEKFVLDCFDGLVVRDKQKYTAGVRGYMFRTGTSPDGSEKGVMISGCINRIISRLTE